MNTNETPANAHPYAGPSTCLARNASSGCCGGPAPAGTDACCAHDAKVKSAGGTGCGCAEAAAPPTVSRAAYSCC